MTRFKQIVSTYGGKALVAIWISIIAILIGFALFGIYKKDLLGYIATSFFPAGILMNISIIIAYKVKNDALNMVKAGWVMLSIAVIVFALVVGNPQYPNAQEETGMIIGYSMFILSFPSCFLIAFLYFGLAYIFEYLGLSSSVGSGNIGVYLSNFVFWLAFFIVGYLQWFTLLPTLFEKMLSSNWKGHWWRS